MASVQDTSSATYRGGPRTPNARLRGRNKDVEVKMTLVLVEGLILNYRIGRKAQDPRQCLIKVLNVEPSEAGRMIGSKVGWPVEDPKIIGKIVSVHGRTGTLRVRFNKGIPGQALGSRVKIFK
jgi:large subunit ribosomal protein L35Ae